MSEDKKTEFNKSDFMGPLKIAKLTGHPVEEVTAIMKHHYDKRTMVAIRRGKIPARVPAINLEKRNHDAGNDHKLRVRPEFLPTLIDEIKNPTQTTLRILSAINKGKVS